MDGRDFRLWMDGWMGSTGVWMVGRWGSGGRAKVAPRLAGRRSRKRRHLRHDWVMMRSSWMSGMGTSYHGNELTRSLKKGALLRGRPGMISRFYFIFGRFTFHTQT